MSTARTDSATAIHSQTLFVIGGGNGRALLNSVEYYVPGVNKWISFAPMIMKRSLHQAGEANNILFVYGGLPRASLDTVEKYDAEEDKWTLVKKYIIPILIQI